MHQIRIRPRPRPGSSQRFPRPPSWILGSTSKGREGRERGRRREEEGRRSGAWERREGKEGEERGKEGKGRGGEDPLDLLSPEKFPIATPLNEKR